MGLLDFLKKKKTFQKTTGTPVSAVNVSPNTSTQGNGVSIIIEQLTEIGSISINKLTEIKNSHIVTAINSLLHSTVTTKSTIENITKEIKSSKDGELCRIIGAKFEDLANSGNTRGAKRGFVRGNKNIDKQVEFVSVKEDHKAEILANTGVAAMDVVSSVVGQYYMNQVNNQLSTLNDNLTKVADFLDIQYQSAVASLVESVYNSSKYQFSNAENEELRRRELDNIQLFKSECQKLLNQAEVTLEKLTDKDVGNYDYYEKNVIEIDKWSQYQKMLIKLLYEIDVIDFALHLGIKSKEQCFASFSLHTEKSASIHSRLLNWHKSQCDLLKINVDECRRKHSGILGWLEKPISLINNDWNYRAIEGETAKMIKGQIAETERSSNFDKSLFEQDVHIIINDGKYYYLPQGEDE